jgi:hypothetical protein
MEAERQRWIRESLTHQARARDEALLAAQAGEQAPAALGSEVRAYLIEPWQQTAAHCANPADVRTRMSSSNERRESMPKKRVSRRALRWSDLLGQAVQAQQAKDWERVERLLGQLQSAPDAPPREPPSQEVLVWYKLQAAFWEHQTAYWQDRALLAEDTHWSVAQVEAMTRGVLRTMVRRVYESLDAAGAPNPTVHALCRELLAQADGRQLDGLLAAELLELDEAAATVAARQHGA